MYRGPTIDDYLILETLPCALRQLLDVVNGYVAYDSGLHVRGACHTPAWHSLRSAWIGDESIHRLFPVVKVDDIPFAQTALGDQFILRDGLVWRLTAETGDLHPTGQSLEAFDSAVRAEPDEVLEIGPLREFQLRGGRLEPGQLLCVMPPRVLNAARDVSYKAVPADDLLRFLADFARQIKDVPDGTWIELTSIDTP